MVHARRVDPKAELKPKFKVYVCTTADAGYAHEAWRLLDEEGWLIPPAERAKRIICVRSAPRGAPSGGPGFLPLLAASPLKAVEACWGYARGLQGRCCRTRLGCLQTAPPLFTTIPCVHADLHLAGQAHNLALTDGASGWRATLGIRKHWGGPGGRGLGRARRLMRAFRLGCAEFWKKDLGPVLGIGAPAPGPAGSGAAEVSGMPLAIIADDREDVRRPPTWSCRAATCMPCAACSH